MDKDNRAKVLEAYTRYLNAVIEADIDAINECIEYPLAYIGGDSVKMLDKFPSPLPHSAVSLCYLDTILPDNLSTHKYSYKLF